MGDMTWVVNPKNSTRNKDGTFRHKVKVWDDMTATEKEVLCTLAAKKNKKLRALRTAGGEEPEPELKPRKLKDHWHQLDENQLKLVENALKFHEVEKKEIREDESTQPALPAQPAVPALQYLR